MGAVAVVAAGPAAATAEAALRAVRAAPHRGDVQEAGALLGAAVAVAYDRGAQDAWIAADGRLLVAFAGALDNADELAAEIARRRGKQPGQSPAEVLLALSRDANEPPAARLRGSFAAIVSDGRRVWCFRDQIGFGTFFFSCRDRIFVGASEGKQVAAGAAIRREPDVEAVYRAFWDRPEGRETALKGIERLPRASLGLWDGEQLRIERYWDPSHLVEAAPLELPVARERLDALLDQAARRMVTGNDAILLSGGVDSPVVAAYAASPHLERGGRPLQAVSILYPEFPDVDEGPQIRLVADALRLPLDARPLRISALADLSRWVDVFDGPSNVINIPSLAEAYGRARATGARNVLTGELAEYVFTLSQHLIGHLILNGRWRPTARWITERRRHGHGWGWIGRDVAKSVAPVPLVSAYGRARRRRSGELAWYQPSPPTWRPDLLVPARERWRRAQLVPFEAPTITHEAADLCAAACGVRQRMPLADVDLWEFLLSLPAETKFPDLVAKSLLRETARGRVPDPILDRRKKTVFNDVVLASADYAGLERHILRSDQRIPDVDYARLRRRIERRELELFELIYAYDLARAHAFLDLWA